MRFAHFFIERPVFAIVLSLVTIIVGAIAIFTLPIAQYPEIAPPTVTVTANYPGANAKTVAETVATPIEEQINGVEGMLYMSSQSTNDGGMHLTVTFKLGTNLDIAQVQVQNRVAIAQPVLPSDVQRAGIVVKKASPDITLAIAIYSPDGSRDPLYLSNYATLQIKDELARLPGVGDIFIFGARDYSMRLWLNPEQLASRNITAGDFVNAVREQNVQVAAGIVGGAPLPPGTAQFQYTVNTQGRLGRSEAVRRNHYQDRCGWQPHAGERCRPHRTRRGGLQHHDAFQRTARRRNSCFPAPRLQFHCDRQRDLSEDGGVEKGFSLRRRLLDSVRHHDLRARQHQGCRQNAFRCRSGSWRWSCLYSCKAGAPRWCRCSRFRCPSSALSR